MDFSYPAEVEQFRTELRDWLSANLTDELVAARRPAGRNDAAFEMLRAWNATMADAGWAAVSWPGEYGGRGATVLEQLVYTEETTRARAPLPLNVIGLNNIAPAIMQYGTESQKLSTQHSLAFPVNDGAISAISAELRYKSSADALAQAPMMPGVTVETGGPDVPFQEWVQAWIEFKAS